MSWFIRSHGQLIRQVCGRGRSQFIQQKLRYSQQKNPDVVVSGKKKYISIALLGGSLIAFGYYVKKERDYGNLNQSHHLLSWCYLMQLLYTYIHTRWHIDFIGYFVFAAIMKERQKQLKKAGIGGKWELFDPNGNKVSSDNFKGKWCMIYFGFTHCPGLCRIVKQ